MSNIIKRAALGAALLVLAAVVASFGPSGRRPPVASALGTCPISFYLSGSTTWAAFTQAAAGPFQALYPGTTDNHAEIGSNNGLMDLDANVPNGAPANTHQNDVAVMSRAPIASASTFEPNVIANTDLNGGPAPQAGSEMAFNYWWQSAADAFVMGVQASWNTTHSNFLSAGLTVTQLLTIYNAQDSWPGGIAALYWDSPNLWSPRAVPAGAPHELIIPRVRITGGGSRTDFDSSIGIPNANENDTYNALGGDGGSYPRLVESADMADAAQNNPDQIAYTSLSQVVPHPGMFVVPIAKTNAGPFLVPSAANVSDGTYALPRHLYIGVHDVETVSRDPSVNPNASEQTRADDYVNYVRSNAGQNLFQAVGFPTIPAANVPPIPDWDVNLDGTTSLGDIGAIVASWGQTSSCAHWIRADAHHDGKVFLGAISVIAQHWGNDGLICDAAHGCTRDPSQNPQ